MNNIWIITIWCTQNSERRSPISVYRIVLFYFSQTRLVFWSNRVEFFFEKKRFRNRETEVYDYFLGVAKGEGEGRSYGMQFSGEKRTSILQFRRFGGTKQNENGKRPRFSLSASVAPSPPQTPFLSPISSPKVGKRPILKQHKQCNPDVYLIHVYIYIQADNLITRRSSSVRVHMHFNYYSKITSLRYVHTAHTYTNDGSRTNM